MILADEDQALDMLRNQQPATDEQMRAVAPAPSRPAYTPPDPLAPTVEEIGAGAIDAEAAKLVHELRQPGALRGLGDAFGAGQNTAREVSNYNADDVTMARVYAPVLEAINKGRNIRDILPNPYQQSELGGEGFALPLARSTVEDQIWSRVQELRRTNPQAAANIPGSRNDLLEDVLAEQRTAQAYGDNLASRSHIDAIANFAGNMAGSFEDPPNILAFALGGPASSTVLRTAIKEGALNTVLDLADLPGRVARQKRMGYDTSAGEIGAELLADFALGGALGAGAHALFHSPVPEVRTAARMIEDQQARAAENPHAPGPQGEDMMRKGALSAMNALQDGRADLMPDTSASIERALDDKIDAMRRRGGFTVESFAPDQLTTDAAAMQYKGGGDAQGVTDRLSGVTQWDPAKAGISLVWEKADGGLVIADGHQRLGLAQRLAGEGGEGVHLYGMRYREADGFTAQDMRVIAALKNIAEGTGSGIDAARLLRDAPHGVKELPPRSALVRQARDLASLSDDAFGMTVNGHASERDAAIVGRHVKDPALQAPILKHLAEESPDSAEEADILVRQALAAGAVQKVQTDMFGDFLKSDLVLPQRVKILKAALSTLRKDKALFSNVTERAEELRAAGNRTATRKNADNAEAAGRSLAMLTALAERKGPISDALQRAAQAATEAGNRRGAVAQFLQDVRGAMERGELDGEQPGDGLGDVGTEAAHLGLSQSQPRDAAAELKSLAPFADPIDKPEAFIRQSHDLALDLAPPREKPPAPKGEGEAKAPEFGEAQSEIEAIRALPQDQLFPDALSDGEMTVREARRRMEREARAVEALRGCMEGAHGV